MKLSQVSPRFFAKVVSKTFSRTAAGLAAAVALFLPMLAAAAVPQPWTFGFQDAATPGVLALIRSAAEAAAAAGLEVGVCGEFAGSVAGAKRLVALGIHELSMEPAVIDEVRATLLG